MKTTTLSVSGVLKSSEPIITDRLIIRPLTEKDFQAWSDAIASGAQSSRSVSGAEMQVPTSQRNLADFQERLKYYRNLRENDRFYHFSAFDRANPSVILGSLSLTILERLIIQRAVIGYHIFPNYQRQGFAAESVKALLAFAFNELSLHRVEALIEVTNRPSSALALAVGMKKEGTLRKAIYDDGSGRGSESWKDALLFSAVAEDFGIKCMKPSVRLEIKDH